MTFQEKIDDIRKRIANIHPSIDTVYAVEKPIIIPDFSKIKNAKVLFKTFSDIMVDYNEVMTYISSVNMIGIKIDEALIDLNNQNVLGSLKVQLRNNLETLQKVNKTYKDLMFTKKEKYDSNIRFMNSVQFILSSPRLEQLDIE